jgi:hypothetical protein
MAFISPAAAALKRLDNVAMISLMAGIYDSFFTVEPPKNYYACKYSVKNLLKILIYEL